MIISSQKSSKTDNIFIKNANASNSVPMWISWKISCWLWQLDFFLRRRFWQYLVIKSPIFGVFWNKVSQRAEIISLYHPDWRIKNLTPAIPVLLTNYILESGLIKVLKPKLGLFGMLKLGLVLQFIVTNAYFSVACNTKDLSACYAQVEYFIQY